NLDAPPWSVCPRGLSSDASYRARTRVAVSPLGVFSPASASALSSASVWHPPSRNVPEGLPREAVAFDTLTPLCSSTHAAAWWSSSTFAGQRPDGAEPVDWARWTPPAVFVNATSDGSPPYDRVAGQVSTVVPILHPSMLIAPVPCVRTFPATVPLNGLRARTIGSNAGLSAVPQPSHCAASGVAGAVMSRSRLCPPSAIDPPRRSARLSKSSPLSAATAALKWVPGFCPALLPGKPIFVPITSRESVASRMDRLPDLPVSTVASIAFPTFMDLGNPLPYSHARESRISNPASSIATARRCQVRAP